MQENPLTLSISKDRNSKNKKKRVEGKGKVAIINPISSKIN